MVMGHLRQKESEWPCQGRAGFVARRGKIRFRGETFGKPWDSFLINASSFLNFSIDYGLRMLKSQLPALVFISLRVE